MAAALLLVLAFIAAGIALHRGSMAAHNVRTPEIIELMRLNRTLVDIDKRLSIASSQYVESSAQAKRTNDVIELFDATNAYASALNHLSEQASRIKLSKLRDNASTPWEEKAIAILISRLGRLSSENSLMVVAANNGRFSSSATAAIDAARRWSDMRNVEEYNALRRAYESLGIDGRSADFGIEDRH